MLLPKFLKIKIKLNIYLKEKKYVYNLTQVK